MKKSYIIRVMSLAIEIRLYISIKVIYMKAERIHAESVSIVAY